MNFSEWVNNNVNRNNENINRYDCLESDNFVFSKCCFYANSKKYLEFVHFMSIPVVFLEIMLFLLVWKLLQSSFFNKDFALAKLSDSSCRQWSNGFTIDCTNRNKSIKWHEEMLSVIKLNHFMDYQLKFHWNHFYVQIISITEHSFCSIEICIPSDGHLNFFIRIHMNWMI